MVSGSLELGVTAEVGYGDRLIRWATTLSVVVLAVIAAVLSYKHMYVLVRRYGETSWTAALLPVSVDPPYQTVLKHPGFVRAACPSPALPGSGCPQLQLSARLW
jgi:hypothetical protein